MQVNVVDLVGHPGASRRLVEHVPVAEFGDDPWGTGDVVVCDPLVLDLHLDSVVEGILVRGEVEFHVEMACGRCLVPQQRGLVTAVAELFVDPERADVDETEPGYELVDDLTRVDLSTMIRDALLADLPLRVLCRDNCAGLCPTCGADRNVEECGHQAVEDVDPRWAALADLKLPPD
ncbi:MAG: DUF177 domain-containing protein [Nitriliruptoraceae bacterium]